MQKIVFFIGLILAAGGLLSPPLGLTAGPVYGLALAHPYHLEARRQSKFLRAASVVGLGFGMNLAVVVKVGRSGLLYTARGITGAMFVGRAIGPWLQVERTSSFLITVGTGFLIGTGLSRLTLRQVGIRPVAGSLAVGDRRLAFPPVGTSGLDGRVSEGGVLSNFRKHRYSLIRSHLRDVTNSIELLRFLLSL